jgi:hypothetical protein
MGCQPSSHLKTTNQTTTCFTTTPPTKKTSDDAILIKIAERFVRNLAVTEQPLVGPCRGQCLLAVSVELLPDVDGSSNNLGVEGRVTHQHDSHIGLTLLRTRLGLAPVSTKAKRPDPRSRFSSELAHRVRGATFWGFGTCANDLRLRAEFATR